MRKLLTILSFLFIVSSASSQEYSQLIFRNDSIFGFNNTTKVFEFIHKRMPSMANQAGKVLSTTGTAYVWVDASAGGPHTHEIGEVTGLQAALNLKANSSHNHAIGEVTGLQAVLDGKAATAHTHAIGEITGLQAALDAKASLSGNEVIINKTFGEFNFGSDANANDSYSITISPAPTSYQQGMIVILRANTINTGAASVNVNGLGAKTIVKRVNTALANGDILAGMHCLLIYDGTNFIILNPVVN